MILSRHLDSRGDGSGVKNANGLYADSVVTFTNGTNLVNLATHGFVIGDGPFTFTTSASLPAELAVLTDYYIGPTVAAGTFDLSLTRGGATIPFTDDGSGTNTLISPFDFYLAPADGDTFFVDKLMMSMRDTAINADDYGAVTALTNGVTVKVFQGSTEVEDLTDSVAVKTSGEWAKVAESDIYAWGAGDVYLGAGWSFSEPIRLDGSQGEKLVVTCHDDLSGLVDHYFFASGTRK